jgi:hypothetical protein
VLKGEKGREVECELSSISICSFCSVYYLLFAAFLVYVSFHAHVSLTVFSSALSPSLLTGFGRSHGVGDAGLRQRGADHPVSAREGRGQMRVVFTCCRRSTRFSHKDISAVVMVVKSS